jgi:hypothetical protein
MRVFSCISGSTTNRPPTRGAPFAAPLVEAAGDAPPPLGLRLPRRSGEDPTRGLDPTSPTEEVVYTGRIALD